jgi:hypothetical protein
MYIKVVFVYISIKMDISGDYSKVDIHTVRMMFEDPIYDMLKEKYGTMLKEFWKTASFPHWKDASNTVLLVERREHPNIEFVIQNAMYYTYSKNFSLTIVCSDVSQEYVKKILGKHLETTHLIPWFSGIGTRDQGRDEYNKTFLNPDFWKQFPAEYILSIQTDSYLRKQIPDCMWEYEYIACPWNWNPRLVGGGGLTWRKKSCVLEILELDFPKTWGEDVFFAHGCEELDLKIPDDTIRHELLAESHFHKLDNSLTDPFGVHQWWTYIMRTNNAKYQNDLFNLLCSCS